MKGLFQCPPWARSFCPFRACGAKQGVLLLGLLPLPYLNYLRNLNKMIEMKPTINWFDWRFFNCLLNMWLLAFFCDVTKTLSFLSFYFY